MSLFWELHSKSISNVFLQGVRQIKKANKFNIEILGWPDLGPDYT